MDLKGVSARGADRAWHLNWLRMREIGQRNSLGYGNKFSKFLYSSMLPQSSWQGESVRGSHHGGVFNLEFSPDGSLLVAACEKRSFLMFDALSHKQVHAVENAHRDCVNCVRFLDSRTFVTCSDDSTVALWDARNLKSSIRTLYGHSNWVKNIEYSQQDGLLVTSGFDGSIYTWDINSYTENGFNYERVFHTNGLMRTRLTPDASKMIICTTGGYLMIIHDLNLKTLSQDLQGFKPNMYRLMQQSQTTIPSASVFTSLFSKKRKRNRIEFVSDFPTHNDAEVVSSLQIHPQGWCALSRNISHEELSEWTCVHDIQDRDDEDSLTENEDLPPSVRDDCDEVMYDDEDIAHPGFRGFPNPNYNSTSDSDDSDVEWPSSGRRAPVPRGRTRTSNQTSSRQEADSSDSASSSDSEDPNPRRGSSAPAPPQRTPVGRFHALLEITRFSSTTTRLLSDSSPLFRESTSTPINNVSSSLPSRRPANRVGGQGEEVNSSPVHRRGGNIRRLRITVDGQVQVSDDDSSGEPASNVRVVDAQEQSRPTGSNRVTANRPRTRHSNRVSSSAGDSSRASSSETSTARDISQSNVSEQTSLRRSTSTSDSAASTSSGRARMAALTARLANSSDSPSTSSFSTNASQSSSPSTSGPSVLTASSSSSSVRQGSSAMSPNATRTSALDSNNSSSSNTGEPASPTVPETSRQATTSSSQNSQPNDTSDAASSRSQAGSSNSSSGSNVTANAAAAVGAMRQARGGQGNIPLTQNMELHVASPDVWEALVVIREARARRQQVPYRNSGRDRSDLISRFLRRLQDLNESPRQQSISNSSGPTSSSSASNSSNANASGRATSSSAAGNSTSEPGSSMSLPDRPRRVLRISRSRQPHRQAQAPAAIALGHFLRNPTPATRTLVMIAPHSGGAQNIHLRVSPNSYSYQSQQLRRPRNHKIHQNMRRLSHFIEEPNVGKGFIKELCFSSDGRVMCSPFSYGIRLLSFTPDCQEISTSLPQDPPVRLYEVSDRMCHEDYVVSSKFSPTHTLLVSGCLKGKIVWHQPNL